MKLQGQKESNCLNNRAAILSEKIVPVIASRKNDGKW